MGRSGIEWTQETWNPLAGCSAVSAGCTHCYAAVMTKRLAAMGQAKYQGLLNSSGHFNGKINFDEGALGIPLRRKKPTVYFVNSMSDLFHENVPFEFIDRVFAVMALCPQHTFQVLTKRPERMAAYLTGSCDITKRWALKAWDLPGGEWLNSVGFLEGIAQGLETVRAIFGPPLPNVWLGTSVENQAAAHRVDTLRTVPAAVRFLSCEPLIGPLEVNLEGIHWVIAGGESGTGARPCCVDWLGDVVAQCKAAGVPCFVKQMGRVCDMGECICGQNRDGHWKGPSVCFNCGGWKFFKDKKGGDPAEWPEDLRVREMPAGVTA